MPCKHANKCICKGSNPGCYSCCNKKWSGKEKCKQSCQGFFGTKSTKYSEPPKGYELDSAEIGTDSGGEYDEYEEMGCRDEIDGSIHGSNLNQKSKTKWKRWRTWILGELAKQGIPNKLRGENLVLFDEFKNATDSATMQRKGSKLSKNIQWLKDPLKTIMRCAQTGPGRNVKKFGYISEPIPDYIMKGLQPKKSAHPVYGKLRY